MKHDITPKDNSLTYVDLLNLTNILLAHSLDLVNKDNIAVAKISKDLAIKVSKLMLEMEA